MSSVSRKTRGTAIALLASIVLSHCGAPNKSAGQVSAMFQADPLSLAERVTSVCTSLKSRTEAPTTSDLQLAALDRCENAGSSAVEVNKFKGLNIEQYTATNGAESDKKRSSFRVQLWLSGALLSLASIAGNMKKFSDPSALGGVGGSTPADLSTLIKAEPKVIEPMKIDMSNGVRGSTILNLVVSGVVKLDLTLNIDFAVLDKSISAVIKTSRAEGLLSDIYVVMVVVPYAGDTYLDLIGSIKMGDALEDAKILDSLIPTMLNSLVSVLFNVNLPEQKQVSSDSQTSLSLYGSDNFSRGGFTRAMEASKP